MNQNNSEKELQPKSISLQEKSLLNKLLPRIFKLKFIEIPTSNQNQVIIQPNKSVLGFKTNCFNKNLAYLQKYISRPEFDKVVFQANKIIEEQVLQNKKRQNAQLFSQSNIIFRIATVLTILGLILMAIIIYGNYETYIQEKLQYTAIVMISLATILVIIIVFLIQTSKFKPSNFDQNVKNKLNQLISQQTKRLASDGRQFLIWGIGEQFFWLSLSISHETIPKRYTSI